MLALGWIFGAASLWTLQLSTRALPSAHIIQGQSPPPCVNNICPDVSGGVRVEVPMLGQSSTLGDGNKPPCEKYHLPEDPNSFNHPSDGTVHSPGAHQAAPITCGDGTKPPCGKYHLTEGPTQSSNHSSNGTVHFTGTRQTAPITCGDGTKPPCGKNHPHSSDPSDGNAHFPSTKQTAPIKCGDGTLPPCGQN